VALPPNPTAASYWESFICAGQKVKKVKKVKKEEVI
jgi:hypothetical protein